MRIEGKLRMKSRSSRQYVCIYVYMKEAVGVGTVYGTVVYGSRVEWEKANAHNM